MTLLLTAERVACPEPVHAPGWVLLDGDRVLDVGSGPEPWADERVDLPERTLAPGFVDLHVHGGGGGGFDDPDPRAVVRAAAFHRARGTTTMMASLVAAPVPELVASARRLSEHVADGTLAGIHLEGPFLSRSRCGAQDPSVLCPPDLETLRRLLAAVADVPAMVTVAPELDGGVEAVRRITGAGAVAAVGHTDADYDTTVAAVAAGARVATHLCNQMPPLHHRAPGPLAALLEDDRVTLELVHDGEHLHPATMRTLLRAAGPDRATWVSDAIPAAGLPDGPTTLGGRAVVVAGGVARLRDGAALAGSTCPVGAMVARAVADGVPATAALAAATRTPATALGLAPEVGVIAPDSRADLVVLDPGWRVESTMRSGRWQKRPG